MKFKFFPDTQTAEKYGKKNSTGQKGKAAMTALKDQNLVIRTIVKELERVEQYYLANLHKSESNKRKAAQVQSTQMMLATMQQFATEAMYKAHKKREVM